MAQSVGGHLSRACARARPPFARPVPARAAGGRVVTDARRASRLLALLAGATLLAGVAGLPFVTSAQTTILNTKHDLRSTRVTTDGTSTNDPATEVCVFCHTPFGTESSATAPLWNGVSTDGTYASYDNPRVSSGAPAVGAVSLVCLSCHDGLSAMSAVLNSPTAGSTTYSGAAVSPDGAATAGTTTTIGGLSTGTQLREDHPVGIQYARGNYYRDAAGAPAMMSPSFREFRTPDSAVLNGVRVWWVDTGGNGRQKTDIVLYTRENTALHREEPFVECASCHDPHTDANPTFLRIPNVGSAVCLSCHIM